MPDMQIPSVQIVEHPVSQELHFDSKATDDRGESESATRVIESGMRCLYKREQRAHQAGISDSGLWLAGWETNTGVG